MIGSVPVAGFAPGKAAVPAGLGVAGPWAELDVGLELGAADFAAGFWGFRICVGVPGAGLGWETAGEFSGGARVGSVARGDAAALADSAGAADCAGAPSGWGVGDGCAVVCGGGLAFDPTAAGAGVGVEAGSVGVGGGGGGGGIDPFGGPYCRTGRCVAGGGGGGLGSLTANIVASNACGPTAIVTWPILVMPSRGGLLGGSLSIPLFLTGFVQYFSNTPSPIHMFRDLCSDSDRTPLLPLLVPVSGASPALRDAKDDVPFLYGLKIRHWQIFGLRVLDGRQGLSGQEHPGQRWRWFFNRRSRCWSHGAILGRRHGAFFGDMFDSRGGASR